MSILLTIFPNFLLHKLGEFQNRIIFKVLLMTFKIINGCAPEYLSHLLETYVPTRSLRSATQGLLVVPKSFTSTYGDRAFSVAAPKLWNNLPANIRTTSALDSFKRKLRPFSFRTHSCRIQSFLALVGIRSIFTTIVFLYFYNNISFYIDCNLRP